MAFPLATSMTTPAIYPSGSTGNGLAAAGFIPEIWSGKLVEKFYNSTVLAAISNTDYQGEIKNQGDTVHIRTKPTITINDYRADGELSLERPVGGTVDLVTVRPKEEARLVRHERAGRHERGDHRPLICPVGYITDGDPRRQTAGRCPLAPRASLLRPRRRRLRKIRIIVQRMPCRIAADGLPP